MARLNAYYRPANVAEALEILGRESGTTALLAGGTDLVARLGDSADSVVDLQAVGLDDVEVGTDRIVLGAMTRLQTIVSHPATPELLRTTALHEGPNTLRNAGTIGGVIVGADWESEFLAALLVSDTEVTIETLAGTKILDLAAFLADVKGALAGGLLTKISLAKEGVTATERVARTPADRAIVAVVGRKNEQGMVALAVCGVAETPVIVPVEHLGALTPPEDFRGTAAYRRQMAMVLGQRVVDALGVG